MISAVCLLSSDAVESSSAVLAPANKNARILWAVPAKGRRLDPDHVSVKPVTPAMAGAAMAG